MLQPSVTSGLNYSSQFTILISMPVDPRRILTYLSLIVYATSLLVVVSPHSDVNGAVGSGTSSIACHADAENCKHLGASHAESCTVCTYFAGRALFVSSPFSLETSRQITPRESTFFHSSYFSVLRTSVSHRGPPSFLTIA